MTGTGSRPDCAPTLIQTLALLFQISGSREPVGRAKFCQPIAKRFAAANSVVTPETRNIAASARLRSACRHDIGLRPNCARNHRENPLNSEKPSRCATNLMERPVDEVRRFMVMFLYLWLMFGLFALHQRILLRQDGLNFTAQGFALVNALVLAKVMLIAEDLKVAHWLRSRPLIYPILGESLIFTVVFICFHIVQHASSEKALLRASPQ